MSITEQNEGEAGKTSQQLKALDVLPEDLVWCPGTTQRLTPTFTTVQDGNALFGI